MVKMTVDDDVSLTSSSGSNNDNNNSLHDALPGSLMSYHTVTVCKKHPHDKIGLTLLYKQTGSDDISDVIVGDVDPSVAVAGLREVQIGDQLIQINGVDVRSRDQVLQLLQQQQQQQDGTTASDPVSAIQLTFLRRNSLMMSQVYPPYTEAGSCNSSDETSEEFIDAGFNDVTDSVDEIASLPFRPLIHNMFHSALTRTALECISEEQDEMTEEDCDEIGRDDVTRCRQLLLEEVDSGLSKTDDSIRNDESSEEQDILDDSPTNSPPGSSVMQKRYCTVVKNSSSAAAMTSPVTHFESDDGNFIISSPSPVSDRMYNIEYAKLDDVMSSTFSSFYETLTKPPVPPRRFQPSTVRHHRHHSPNDVILPMGFERLCLTDDVARSTASSQVNQRRVPRMGTKLNLNLNVHATVEQLHTSNTDTSRQFSSENDDNVAVNEQNNFMTVRQRQRCVILDFDSIAPPPPLLDQLDDCNSSKHSRPGLERVSRATQTEHCDRVEAYQQCADIMYTNRANLLHTIAVQQQLFRQQLADRRPSSTVASSSVTSSSSTGCPDDPLRSKGRSNRNHEWVVRRRSDGSRYLSRRPAKSSISGTCERSLTSSRRNSPPTLSDSAPRFVEAWTTTDDDDDDRESPKAGRYWTREQRRQHVLERRQKDAAKRERSYDVTDAPVASSNTAAAAAVADRTKKRLNGATASMTARRALARDFSLAVDNVEPLAVDSYRRRRVISGLSSHDKLLSVATV